MEEAGSPIPRAPESKQSLLSPMLDDGESARKALLGDLVPVGGDLRRPLLEGGAVGGDGLLEALGSALALAQGPKRVAQVVLGHGPVEGDALPRPLLEGG